MENTTQADTGAEYLAFKMGREEYGLNILRVHEIRGYEKVTRMANAPEFMKGVVNLRGTIVPIIDMRILLRLGTPTYDQFTIVIVLNIAGRTTGIVVDSVSDVTTLAPEDIRPAPDLGAQVASDYVIGLGTRDDRMLILIDIEKLIGQDVIGSPELMAA